MRPRTVDASFIAALAMGVAAVLPFIQLDGRLILEPDLLAGQIAYFYDVISTGAWLHLPPQGPGNVYFEGNIIVYAFATHLYQAVRALFAPPIPVYQAGQVTAGLVNALAHIAATGLFFATVRRLAGTNVVALLLTALFTLSPQIIAIDLVRSDRLILPGLVGTLHASVAITRREATWREGLLLGLALPLVLSIKFTGAVFAAFPATAVLIVLAEDRRDARLRRTLGTVAAAAALTATPVLTLLMIRHVLHPGAFTVFLKLGYAGQIGAFKAFFKITPLLYYNVDLFLGYGAIFLGLSAAAVIVVAWQAVRLRDPTAMWLIANLLLFSAMGAAVYKYSRGGYHLVPLYLYALAMASRPALDILTARMGKRPSVAVGVVALLIPVATAGFAFAESAAIALKRPDSIAHTRLASRAWIAAQFKAGDRICMISGSEWANPHLDGLGLFVATRIFDIPLEHAAAAAGFIPPTPAQVRAACDGVVLDDLHKNTTLAYYRDHGLAEMGRAWQELFDQLDQRFSAHHFVADTPAYFVARVDVYDLREPLPIVGEMPPLLAASRRALLAGEYTSDELRFAGGVVPLAPDHFRGAVDGAVLYDKKYLLLEGWAAHATGDAPAVAIVIADGGRVIGYDGTATEHRPDVAEFFKTPSLQLAGYITCVNLDGPPTEALSLIAVGRDGTAGKIDLAGEIAIRDAAPNAPLPDACRSVEGNAYW